MFVANEAATPVAGSGNLTAIAAYFSLYAFFPLFREFIGKNETLRSMRRSLTNIHQKCNLV